MVAIAIIFLYPRTIYVNYIALLLHFVFLGDSHLLLVELNLLVMFCPTLQGHEGRFSVYVHASKDKPVHFSRYFINREIRSSSVCFLFLIALVYISYADNKYDLCFIKCLYWTL